MNSFYILDINPSDYGLQFLSTFNLSPQKGGILLKILIPPATVCARVCVHTYTHTHTRNFTLTAVFSVPASDR